MITKGLGYGWLSARRRIRDMVLPVVTLAISLLAHLVRQTRSGIVDVLSSDYARAARLRGLPEWVVIVRHVLPSGMSVALTVLALDLGYLMGSVLIVEQIFAYPGLGNMAIDAVINRDLPLIQGIVILFAVIFTAVNLVVDLCYAALNPRLRHA